MRKRNLLLLCCAWTVIAASVAAQTISTVAGGATPVGLAATAFGANQPGGVAVDAGGNLYIALTGANQVWIVNAAGAVTSIIGNGTGGYSGDGGPAASAQLYTPAGIALDSAGNIYIADSNNSAIRKVTVATGIISTIAGTGTYNYNGDGEAATSAQLAAPNGVAVDSSGNVYIADSYNRRVRKITAATGIISTIAGNGVQGYSGDGQAATNAEVGIPVGIALDTAGNIYIADIYNFVVRKITASTGIISTVAGVGRSNGTIGEAADGGPATSAQLNSPFGLTVDPGGNLYFADSGENLVRKVAAGTGIISTVAGNGTAGYTGNGGAATSAELNEPIGVALDTSGNLYIADSENNVVRKITAATGNISTVAGNGTAGLTGDGGAATSAQLSQPGGVAVDSVGNVYIADSQNNAIRKVTAATGIISTVAGNGTPGFMGDGGAATSAELHSPSGVALDSGDNLYIADLSNAVIRKVAAGTGIISTVAGDGTGGYQGDGGVATSAEISFAYGVAVDSSGNLYIADGGANVIRKVTAATGIISTVAGNGMSGYSGDGAAATSAELRIPTDVAVDSSGNLYIADGENSVIRKVTAATGNISTIAGTGVTGYSGDGGAATSAKLYYPYGVAVDSSGNVYVADTTNNAIRKITAATGVINTVAGTGTFGFSGDGGPATGAELASPEGVTIGSTGEIFVADSGNDRIRAITPSFGPATQFMVTAPASATLGTAFNFTVTALDVNGNTAQGYAGTVHFTSSGGATLPADSTLAGGVGIFSATAGNAVSQTITATDTVTAGITGTSGTIVVTKPVLTVTANAVSVGYGAAIPVLTATITGFVNGDTAAVVTGSASLNTTATAGSGVGQYPITVGQGTLAAANYTFGTFTNSQVTITKAVASVTPNAASKTYGAADPAFTGTLTGFLVGDNVTASYSRTAGENVAGSPYTISALLSPAGVLGNYNITYSTANFTINKAVLTVTANAVSVTVGSAIPALTANITGFMNGDTAAAVVTGTPSLSTTATSGSTAGEYPITVTAGTLATANYTFNFVNGMVTVSSSGSGNGGTGSAGGTLPPNLMIGFGANTISFGSATTLNFSLSNPNLSSALTGITVTDTLPSGLAVATPNGLTGSCGKVTAAGSSIALTGGALAAAASCTFSVNVNAIGVGTQNNTTGLIFSTQASGNYGFAQLIVTQAKQAITFGAVSPHVYGDAPFSVSATASSGLPVVFSATSGPCSVAGATVQITGAGNCIIAANQAGNTNYAPAGAASQTVPVAKAVLTVTANSATGLAGAALPAFSASYAGFLNGDTPSVLTGVPSITTTATATSSAGTYPIIVAAGTLAAASYSFAFANGTLTLTAQSAIANGGSFGPGVVAPNTILSYYGPVGCLPNEQLLINGSAATILFANATQINFVVPASVAPEIAGANNSASIQLICNGTPVSTNSTPMAAVSPLIFTQNSTGTGPGSILNLDGKLNTAADPAAQGSYISVYVTGFGVFNPAGADGLEHLAATVTATIGGVNAIAIYAGEAPGYTSGLQQINVQIPTGIATGPNVPIVLSANGVATQNGVTVAVK